MVENQSNITSGAAEKSQDIVQQARQHILKLFNQKHDSRLVYHNYAQTAAILEQVQKLEKAMKVADEVVEIALLAACFQLTGYLENTQRAAALSIEFARQFLQNQQYPAEKLQQVVQTLDTAFRGKATTAAEALLLDATNAVRYAEDFMESNALLRLELELIENRQLDKSDWRQRQLEQLLRVQFFTPYGKLHFAPKVAQHILKLKSQLEKTPSQTTATALSSTPQRPFQQLTTDATSRAAQTFFRTNYRIHINLSAIADNKANIMISVNAVLVSVLITFLSYQNIGQTQPRILLPVLLFIVTGLTSLTFAVLSARPKVTKLNTDQLDLNQIKRNIAFFGNFVTLGLEQYEEALDAILRDDELLYGNMGRDLYYLGKVLEKKYYFLTLSYNTFMIGFFATAIAFLIALFV